MTPQAMSLFQCRIKHTSVEKLPSFLLGKWMVLCAQKFYALRFVMCVECIHCGYCVLNTLYQGAYQCDGTKKEAVTIRFLWQKNEFQYFSIQFNSIFFGFFFISSNIHFCSPFLCTYHFLHLPFTIFNISRSKNVSLLLKTEILFCTEKFLF